MSAARADRRALLHLEQLESRITPTAYTVTSAVDSATLTGAVTLREALMAAETHKAVGSAPAGTASNTIKFDIPGSGIHTINLTSALPALTGSITIDATTQPGYKGLPLIVLNGAKAGSTANGLVLNGNSNTVKGLAIDNFSGDGILVSSNYNTISADFVGIDPTGYFSKPNGKDGVLVTGKDNVIGGTTASARDVLSGNSKGAGVDLSGTSATGNIVEGDYIGTDAYGFAAEANDYGVLIQAGANHNTIGGTSAAYRNVISGNTLDEIRITGAGTTGNLVEGNFIGPDSSGDAAALSGRDGVRIDSGATNNQIGGTVSGSGNLIGGAGSLSYVAGMQLGIGIYIIGSTTSGNVVEGNWIGVNAAGLAPLQDLAGGIILSGAGKNTIGGTSKAAKNMISDQTNSSGIAATNQVLPADWFVDSIEFIINPSLRDGSFKA